MHPNSKHWFTTSFLGGRCRKAMLGVWHELYLRMRFCIKWCDMVHGLVHTERAETAAVSRGTSHVTTKQRCKYTTSVDIQNALQWDRKNDSRSSRITCDKSEWVCLTVGWLKCCFTSTETVGLLGTGALDVHLDFHTTPELCYMTAQNSAK